MSDQLMIDAIGFAAASLVLATFCMRTMGALRWVALASNLVFIAYGYLGNLAPVLLLHALLLPVNAYRLTQLWWADGVRSERTEQKDTIMAGKGGRTRHSGRAMAALSPLIFVLAVLAAGTAQAHSVRYISSTGSDSSNCTRATPCLTLQRGIDRTAAGSELIILDSGDFGDGATIDKSITISAIGVSATLGAGITINATDAIVVLRGLRLNGGGAGANGIEIVTGATAQVHVEDCEVQGFENGINVDSDASPTLFIANSVVRGNSGADLYFQTGTPGRLVIADSRFENNGGEGIEIRAGEASITRGIVSGNGANGIEATFSGKANVTWTTAEHNGGSGYFVSTGQITLEQSVARGNAEGVRTNPGSGSTATVRLSGSVVTNNGVDLSATGTGTSALLSRGNNTIGDTSWTVLSPLGGL